MRGVSGVSKGGAVPAGTRVGARSASGFSVAGAVAGGAAAATGAASATAAVGISLLAAQETGDRAGRDAMARRRANTILDELRALQAELLGGRPDAARLARLAALGDGEDGTDPGLREAVRAVALRARIEVARRAGNATPDRSTTVA